MTTDQPDERPAEDDTDALDRAIGRVVRAAGHTEWLLAQLYQLLICSPHAATLAAGMSVHDLGASIGQLALASRQPVGVSAFDGRQIDDATCAGIVQAVSTARKLSSERNAAVHGYWGLNGWDRTQHVTLLSKRLHADPTVAFWTPATLDELRRNYATLEVDLYRLIEELLEITPQSLRAASDPG